MKISKQLLFLMALAIAGCKSNVSKTAKQRQPDTIGQGKKETVKKTALILSCDSTIVNNEFSFNALAFGFFKADTAKIKSLFINPVILKLEKQKNSEGGSYDLYNFTDGTNKLTLYYNKGFYLQEGDIKSGGVLLNKKISIGMTEDSFLKLVKASNIKCDIITVVNDESTFETVYLFNNYKLKEIKMGQILE